MSARVSLVGAGPGDPGLVTLRAVERMRAADLILYDALVTGEVLALAPHTRRFPVGKRAGQRGVPQEAIHRLMVRWARRGRQVVRLKCGDPFVFGRGGEEAMALAAAGIGVEIVPGVSSALAAPGLAGIPITCRGASSAFVVVSGHAADAYRPVLAGMAPRSATVVVLMGLRGRAEIARFLLENGWPAFTPAAALLAASTRRAWTWLGTLGTLSAADLEDQTGPGTLVIGEVVALAPHYPERLPWPNTAEGEARA